MKKLLNGTILFALAIAPGFTTPLSRLQKVFTPENLAAHTVPVVPSVTAGSADDNAACREMSSSNSSCDLTSAAIKSRNSAAVPLAVTASPEPGSIILMLMGGAAIVWLRRRHVLNAR
jgi:hypothetical protein